SGPAARSVGPAAWSTSSWSWNRKVAAAWGRCLRKPGRRRAAPPNRSARPAQRVRSFDDWPATPLLEILPYGAPAAVTPCARVGALAVVVADQLDDVEHGQVQGDHHRSHRPAEHDDQKGLE